MKKQMIQALKNHAVANIHLHKTNIDVYFANPAGIGEHSDITEAIGVELDKISRYHDQLEVIAHYFKKR